MILDLDIPTLTNGGGLLAVLALVGFLLPLPRLVRDLRDRRRAR